MPESHLTFHEKLERMKRREARYEDVLQWDGTGTHSAQRDKPVRDDDQALALVA